ncbi:MAG: hypothetical protein RLZZ192_67 [Pseudomonadota bacterium]
MKHLFIALLMAVATLVAPSSAWAQDSVSVVYHIDDADAQGLKGLRNIRNHLDVAPKTKIRVVTHANGVDILMDGAKDKSGKVEYASLVSALVSRGVVFEVCEITLKNRNLKREQFLLEATFTASGVVRIAELQAKEKYAYIKP